MSVNTWRQVSICSTGSYVGTCVSLPCSVRTMSRFELQSRPVRHNCRDRLLALHAASLTRQVLAPEGLGVSFRTDLSRSCWPASGTFLIAMVQRISASQPNIETRRDPTGAQTRTTNSSYWYSIGVRAVYTLGWMVYFAPWPTVDGTNRVVPLD